MKLNEAQLESLHLLNDALVSATNSGLLDKLTEDLNPDCINDLCENVEFLWTNETALPRRETRESYQF